MKRNTAAFHDWIAAGRPQESHPTVTEKKSAKKELRRALRQAEAQQRANLYDDILQASSSDLQMFHRLIRRQRSQGRVPDGTAVCPDGQDILATWADQFKKLAVPVSDPGYDQTYHELVSTDVQVIEQLSSIRNQVPTSISLHDVTRAICKLNSGKASDIHGLAPEHIKFSAEACAPLLLLLIQAVLEARYIPPQLKDSYILPIHKKGKDPAKTITEESRYRQSSTKC